MSRTQLAHQIELLAQHLREDPNPGEHLGIALTEACREWDRRKREVAR